MLRLVIVILLLIPICVIGQQDIYLNVRNTRRPVQLKFQTGAELTIRIDHERLKYRGTLEEIGDSSLVLDGVRISYNRISQLVLTRRAAKAIKYGALSSIPFFITVTALDRGINQNASPLIDDSALRLSASYAALAGISSLFQNRKIKFGKQWEMHKLDLRP